MDTNTDSKSIQFAAENPSLDNYWRAIILFGRNVASYKFALGQSLLEFAHRQDTFVPLEDLAEPFSRHLVEHVREGKKQITSSSSRFLDACRGFADGKVDKDSLIETTVKLGFNNVIDAFHVVAGGEVPLRFFTDERAGKRKGIRLTDELFRLAQSLQGHNLPHEVDARWRLVETAWELNLSRNLIVVDFDPSSEALFTTDRLLRRVDVTSCREALNGYQCFGSAET